MAERSWIIGSSPDCDMQVESPLVSSRHCRISQRGESYLLEDLSSANGTFVSGERLTSPRIVRRGDRVTLGRNTPLPWPPEIVSITIGRSPDSDFVIPLDIVSGCHARLEREGNQVTLIDCGSSNGTAINDPLNRITRAALHPSDKVFFGTHSVPAGELFKALPTAQRRQTTVLEEDARDKLDRELDEHPSQRGAQARGGSAHEFSSLSSWKWGILLSVCCGLAVLGVGQFFRSDSGSGETKQELVVNSAHLNDDPASPVDPSASSPDVAIPIARQLVPENQIRLPATPKEEDIRRFENAVVLIGARIDGGLLVTSVPAWAFQLDRVVCPTSTLQLLEKELHEFQSLDTSLVVCTPGKTLAILEYSQGQGPAEGFSLAKLEAPLEAACVLAPGDVQLVPDQTLGVLNARCLKKDDPLTMERQFHMLRLERIERSTDKSPLLLHCRSREIAGELWGSPVFDATGAVVACAGPSAAGIQLVPVARLRELLSSAP